MAKKKALAIESRKPALTSVSSMPADAQDAIEMAEAIARAAQASLFALRGESSCVRPVSGTKPAA